MLFKIPGETFEQKLKLCCVQMLKHLSQPLESGVVKGMLEKKKKRRESLCRGKTEMMIMN